ncbi:MAG: hypothetical protein ACFFFK_00555, partial [Candidatus Thorarchaeota archaeon]
VKLTSHGDAIFQLRNVDYYEKFSQANPTRSSKHEADFKISTVSQNPMLNMVLTLIMFPGLLLLFIFALVLLAAPIQLLSLGVGIVAIFLLPRLVDSVLRKGSLPPYPGQAS